MQTGLPSSCTETELKTTCHCCKQKIAYTADQAGTLAVCPACQKETWLPTREASDKFKELLDALGLPWLFRVSGKILWQLWTALGDLFAFVFNHIIGFAGVGFILGTVILTVASPVVVAANVFLTGEGFGFVLVALDILIDQGRRRLQHK